MKWAAGGLAATVVAVVVALVLAIGSTRDTVPGKLRTCAIDGGAGVILSATDLGGLARTDIGAGVVKEVSRTKVGDDTAVLLTGSSYRLLVLAGRGSPPLSGDLPRRVYDDASKYALVARELDPVRDVLRDCVSLVAEP